MSIPPSSRVRSWCRVAVPAVLAALALGASGVVSASAAHRAPGVKAAAVTLPPVMVAPADTTPLTAVRGALAALFGGEQGMFGRSGKLLARFLVPKPSTHVPVLARWFGDSVLTRPSVVYLEEALEGRPLTLITLVPFSEKVRGRIGTYRMGFWPFEQGTARSGAYANPPGFIQVTLANRDTRVSEHFRLRDFLTKDQTNVWPKYLVLREELVDKLELVIQELEQGGVNVEHMQVMSGFRTPQYNQQGVGAGGRAQNSRHQYGDAADVFVDNDRNGRLDDLNRDGRVDTRDVGVMVAAAERVERRYPDLVGGAGVYRANSAHGPFVHIDVRGNRARW